MSFQAIVYYVTHYLTTRDIYIPKEAKRRIIILIYYIFFLPIKF